MESTFKANSTQISFDGKLIKGPRFSVFLTFIIFCKKEYTKRVKKTKNLPIIKIY